MEELNLYILTANRNKDNIVSFINEFTNKNEVILLNDEVMVVPENYTGDLEQIKEKEYDWINVKNIDDVIELGTLSPIRAFSCYLKIYNKKIKSIILGFTIDKYLILGLSFENSDVNYKFSEELLNKMFTKYSGIHGGVFIEQFPAHSKDLFNKYLKERSLYKL